MIMFFGFPFSFGFFLFIFGILKIRIGIFLSASAFNSCMNVVKLCFVRNGSSISTAVNERGEGTVVAVRAYLCRCTSFPFYDDLLWLHSTDDRKGDGFFLFQTITSAQVRFFLFYFYNAFPHFFSTFTIRPSIPSLFYCPTGHESHRFQSQSRIKVNTSIAIISIYIPVELTFDTTLIESKGIFGQIKKWDNCNFSWITLFQLIFSKNLQVNYKNIEIMNFDFKFQIILL